MLVQVLSSEYKLFDANSTSMRNQVSNSALVQIGEDECGNLELLTHNLLGSHGGQGESPVGHPVPPSQQSSLTMWNSTTTSQLDNIQSEGTCADSGCRYLTPGWLGGMSMMRHVWEQGIERLERPCNAQNLGVCSHQAQDPLHAAKWQGNWDTAKFAFCDHVYQHCSPILSSSLVLSHVMPT